MSYIPSNDAFDGWFFVTRVADRTSPAHCDDLGSGRADRVLDIY